MDWPKDNLRRLPEVTLRDFSEVEFATLRAGFDAGAVYIVQSMEQMTDSSHNKVVMVAIGTIGGWTKGKA